MSRPTANPRWTIFKLAEYGDDQALELHSEHETDTQAQYHMMTMINTGSPHSKSEFTILPVYRIRIGEEA